MNTEDKLRQSIKKIVETKWRNNEPIEWSIDDNSLDEIVKFVYVEQMKARHEEKVSVIKMILDCLQ